MQTATPSAADGPLYDLVSGPSLATIPDAIARMQNIDALLPVTDGLKWFNRLYLMVTQQVDLCPPGGAWFGSTASMSSSPASISALSPAI